MAARAPAISVFGDPLEPIYVRWQTLPALGSLDAEAKGTKVKTQSAGSCVPGHPRKR